KVIAVLHFAKQGLNTLNSLNPKTPFFLLSEHPFRLDPSLIPISNQRNSMAGNASAPSGVDKEQIFGMAEKEMEYRVDMFNRLTHTCFNKCMEKRYKEAELNMGETSCIDRCVSKYSQVTNLVGQLLGSNQPPV
ncbi:hypothetical protein GIB67_007644, partial [Kingdonia uniflora]